MIARANRQDSLPESDTMFDDDAKYLFRSVQRDNHERSVQVDHNEGRSSSSSNSRAPHVHDDDRTCMSLKFFVSFCC